MLEAKSPKRSLLTHFARPDANQALFAFLPSPQDAMVINTVFPATREERRNASKGQQYCYVFLQLLIINI